MIDEKASSIDWESFYQQWLEASLGRRQDDALRIEKNARTLLNNRKLKDVGWLLDVLDEREPIEPSDMSRRPFLLSVLTRAGQIPWRLHEPLLLAAIREPDPSFNRLFMEPCVRFIEMKNVLEFLLDVLHNGTNLEKAGAVSASYWLGDPGLKRHPKPCPECKSLWRQFRYLKLSEFLANPDPDVRARIIPMLNLDPAAYPEEYQPQVQAAIEIGLSSGDEYISHRTQIQLGSGGPYKPIPPMRTPDEDESAPM